MKTGLWFWELPPQRLTLNDWSAVIHQRVEAGIQAQRLRVIEWMREDMEENPHKYIDKYIGSK